MSGHHFIQQWNHIFPSNPFAADTLKALLIAIDILHNILFSGFDFPSCISACLDSISVFLLGYLFLPFIYSLFMSEFCQEHLIHPCSPPNIFCLTSCLLRQIVLELAGLENPPFRKGGGHLPNKALSNRIIQSRALKRTMPALMKSRAVTLIFVLLFCLRILNSTISR